MATKKPSPKPSKDIKKSNVSTENHSIRNNKGDTISRMQPRRRDEDEGKGGGGKKG